MRFWHVSPRIGEIGFRTYLRRLAGSVWNEQKHAYAKGINLQEESITECLLLQMSRDLSNHGFRAKIYTREREATTGADWVWFFRRRSCSLGYRVQAKKLYRKFGTGNNLLPGSYDGHNPRKNQAKNLVSRAGPNYPIYIFYNHDEVSNHQVFKTSSRGFLPPSFWGCSFAPAQFVEKTKSCSLAALRPGMRPWHELFLLSKRCGVRNSATADDNMRYYRANPEWMELSENPVEMQSYLSENNLNGIVHFDATDVSEDIFVPR